MELKRKVLAAAVLLAATGLTACGGSSSSKPDPVVTPDPVTPTNSAPSDISLTSASVDENKSGVIGTLSTTDADTSDTFTYAIDSTIFSIDGDQLSVIDGMSLNYEEAQSVMLSITVTDSAAATFTKELSITVNDILEVYSFNSEFEDGQSSVSYGGQTTRHALIAELKHYIGKGGLQADIDDNNLADKAAVLAKLNSFYHRDENAWDGFAISFTDGWTVPAKQKLFTDIGSYKSLKDKVAGNDASGQHKEWNNGDFAGWGAKGSITPDGLIAHFFDQLADNAAEVISGASRVDPITGKNIDVYVNTDGTDLNQLIQKFLLMAITYSQATDDYLDAEKGLATDNIGQDKGTKTYTKLEHQYDEGFGYFGATRDYLYYTDNEISGKVKTADDGRVDWNGQHDSDGDAEIDLLSEHMFGNSVNAAKRDRGTKDNAMPTDYTKQAMEAFISGRKIINDNAGMALTAEQMTELLVQKDIAIDAWERAIVATVIHYINDLSDDLEPLRTGEGEFDFTTAAKHFSELKGFALGLQFNPKSQFSATDFESMHTLLKDAPVLEQAGVAAYQNSLLAIRNSLQEAYNFDDENVAGW